MQVEAELICSAREGAQNGQLRTGAAVSIDPAFKSCRCGASYSLFEWWSLRFVGIQHVRNSSFELRVCGECGSTISIRIDRSREVASDLPNAQR
jgi:hypothetical protein